MYESLLTCIVALFRRYSIELFVEHEAPFRDGNGDRALPSPKSNLLNDLNTHWPGYLPKPLDELVRVSVNDIEIDSYNADEARDQVFRLRNAEAAQVFRMKSDLDKTLKFVQDLIMTSSDITERSGDESGMRDRFSSKVNAAHTSVIQATGRAVAKINEFRPDTRISAAFCRRGEGAGHIIH